MNWRVVLLGVALLVGHASSRVAWHQTPVGESIEDVSVAGGLVDGRIVELPLPGNIYQVAKAHGEAASRDKRGAESPDDEAQGGALGKLYTPGQSEVVDELAAAYAETAPSVDGREILSMDDIIEAADSMADSIAQKGQEAKDSLKDMFSDLLNEIKGAMGSSMKRDAALSGESRRVVAKKLLEVYIARSGGRKAGHSAWLSRRQEKLDPEPADPVSAIVDAITGAASAVGDAIGRAMGALKDALGFGDGAEGQYGGDGGKPPDSKPSAAVEGMSQLHAPNLASQLSAMAQRLKGCAGQAAQEAGVRVDVFIGCVRGISGLGGAGIHPRQAGVSVLGDLVCGGLLMLCGTNHMALPPGRLESGERSPGTSQRARPRMLSSRWNSAPHAPGGLGARQIDDPVGMACDIMNMMIDCNDDGGTEPGDDSGNAQSTNRARVTPTGEVAPATGTPAVAAPPQGGSLEDLASEAINVYNCLGSSNNTSSRDGTGGGASAPECDMDMLTRTIQRVFGLDDSSAGRGGTQEALRVVVQEAMQSHQGAMKDFLDESPGCVEALADSSTGRYRAMSGLYRMSVSQDCNVKKWTGHLGRVVAELGEAVGRADPVQDLYKRAALRADHLPRPMHLPSATRAPPSPSALLSSSEPKTIDTSGGSRRDNGEVEGEGGGEEGASGEGEGNGGYDYGDAVECDDDGHDGNDGVGPGGRQLPDSPPQSDEATGDQRPDSAPQTGAPGRPTIPPFSYFPQFSAVPDISSGLASVSGAASVTTSASRILDLTIAAPPATSELESDLPGASGVLPTNVPTIPSFSDLPEFSNLPGKSDVLPSDLPTIPPVSDLPGVSDLPSVSDLLPSWLPTIPSVSEIPGVSEFPNFSDLLPSEAPTIASFSDLPGISDLPHFSDLIPSVVPTIPSFSDLPGVSELPNFSDLLPTNAPTIPSVSDLPNFSDLIPSEVPTIPSFSDLPGVSELPNFSGPLPTNAPTIPPVPGFPNFSDLIPSEIPSVPSIPDASDLPPINLPTIPSVSDLPALSGLPEFTPAPVLPSRSGAPTDRSNVDTGVMFASKSTLFAASETGIDVPASGAASAGEPSSLEESDTGPTGLAGASTSGVFWSVPTAEPTEEAGEGWIPTWLWPADDEPADETTGASLGDATQPTKEADDGWLPTWPWPDDDTSRASEAAQDSAASSAVGNSGISDVVVGATDSVASGPSTASGAADVTSAPLEFSASASAEVSGASGMDQIIGASDVVSATDGTVSDVATLSDTSEIFDISTVTDVSEGTVESEVAGASGVLDITSTALDTGASEILVSVTGAIDSVPSGVLGTTPAASGIAKDIGSARVSAPTNVENLSTAMVSILPISLPAPNPDVKPPSSAAFPRVSHDPSFVTHASGSTPGLQHEVHGEGEDS